MANPKPLLPDASLDAVQSALRTLDAGSNGIAALAAALRGALGTSFGAAVELIRQAKGRVIVTGLGKSGHIGRKVAATLASTGTPAFFVHAAEASHGDLGMITPDDVILALSWSGEQPEMKNLVNYSARFAIPMIAVTSDADSSLGSAARIVLELPKVREACPHNLAPTTSTLMQAAIGDALAIALLGRPRLHGARVRKLPPGRQAWGDAQTHQRPHAHRRCRAPETAGHEDVRSGGRNVSQGFWLRRDRRRARACCWNHHRRRSAPAHASRPDRRAGRRRHDQKPEDHRQQFARQRSAQADVLEDQHA